MRIVELAKLIKNEETKPHCLKNCSIVIDGNNYLYNIYEYNKIPYVFGSEANVHAIYVRHLLKQFRNANVKCYFVFKGGCSDMTKKLDRAKLYQFDFESNYNFVSPVFIKEVCKQVINEEGINYATCIMESKEDCVALAQKLGCSVLSNDIEFCFKKAPYISYLSLRFKRDAITCGQYNINDFLHKHSITDKKFAIFGTVSDAFVFPQKHFNELFDTWGVADATLYTQHKKLLKWLSEHDEDEIVNDVLEFLSSEDEKQRFLKEIENILSSMHNSRQSVVTDYLYNDCKLQVSRVDPLWFDKGVATQNIAIPYIDLCKHKIIRGSTFIEKKDCTESLLLSIDIIKYAYNLLTNFQANASFSIFQGGDSYININASDSNIRKPVCCTTEPVFQNGWKDINRLKLFQHFLTEKNINADKIHKLPGEARMLIIALAYFAREKSAKGVDVTKQVYSFIICHVMLRVVYDKASSLRKKSSGISEEDSIEAQQATEKYFKIEKEEEMQMYDEDDLQTFVELQLCLSHMNDLNVLCGKPYKPTIYHRSFNGTFIYKLFYAMRDRNHNQFIESLFQAAPSVYKFINKLITIYNELV